MIWATNLEFSADYKANSATRFPNSPWDLVETWRCRINAGKRVHLELINLNTIEKRLLANLEECLLSRKLNRQRVEQYHQTMIYLNGLTFFSVTNCRSKVTSVSTSITMFVRAHGLLLPWKVRENMTYGARLKFKQLHNPFNTSSSIKLTITTQTVH